MREARARARNWMLLAVLISAHCSSADVAEPAAAPAQAPSAAASAASSSTPSAAPTSTSTVTADAGPAVTPVSCAGKSAPKGDQNIALDWGQQKRTTRLHVPAAIDPSKPAMLVLNFHGLYMDSSQEELVSKMTAASDAHRFIVAYPQGIGQSWNAGNCCGPAYSQSIDDVGFVRALITKLETDYCIDPKRVFSTGLSNGGELSYHFACDMADVFAAVAPVAGVLLDPSCTPSRPVPILHFHGTADPIVAYGGNGPNPGFPGAKDSLAVFAAKYGCAGATPTTISTKGDTTCVETPGCSAALRLCTIDGGGHTWPGGVPLPFGKTSSDMNATETMIDFFDKHPMP